MHSGKDAAQKAAWETRGHTPADVPTGATNSLKEYDTKKKD